MAGYVHIKIEMRREQSSGNMHSATNWALGLLVAWVRSAVDCVQILLLGEIIEILAVVFHVPLDSR